MNAACTSKAKLSVVLDGAILVVVCNVWFVVCVFVKPVLSVNVVCAVEVAELTEIVVVLAGAAPVVIWDV